MEKIIEDKYKIVFEEKNNRFRVYENVNSIWEKMEKILPSNYIPSPDYYDYIVLQYRKIYNLINKYFPESQFGFEENGFITFLTNRDRALERLELKNKLTKKQWRDIHKYKHDYCR